jgi:hypothetical protein
MIVATAAADGELINRPEPWRRLTRVKNPG